MSPLGKQKQRNFEEDFTVEIEFRKVCHCGDLRRIEGCERCKGILKVEFERWERIQAANRVSKFRFRTENSCYPGPRRFALALLPWPDLLFSYPLLIFIIWIRRTMTRTQWTSQSSTKTQRHSQLPISAFVSCWETQKLQLFLVIQRRSVCKNRLKMSLAK